MTTLKVLKAARARIFDEKHWCQGSLAMDAKGKHVTIYDPSAVKWCILGSIYKECRGDYREEEAINQLDITTRERYKDHTVHSAVSANDILGHKEIIKVLNQTIDRLEQSNT